MYLTFVIIILLLRILSVNTSVVSEEQDLAKRPSNDRVNQEPKGIQRKFIDNLNDKDWHVTKLKSIDFENDCEAENDNKVDKYRKALIEDGSLVKYVSANALPVNKKDMEVKKCIRTNNTNNEKQKRKKKKIRRKNYSNNATDQIVNDKSVTKQVNSATKADSRKTANDEHHETGEKSRRSSEYQFASAEYYEELDEFPVNTCPEYLEVIKLEVDFLKEYDVECEGLVVWRSLSDKKTEDYT